MSNNEPNAEDPDVQMLEQLAGEDPELMELAGPLVAAAGLADGPAVDVEAELHGLLAEGMAEAQGQLGHLQAELDACIKLADPSGGSRKALAERLGKLRTRLQALRAWSAE